jgi:hypothetical protein
VGVIKTGVEAVGAGESEQLVSVFVALDADGADGSIATVAQIRALRGARCHTAAAAAAHTETTDTAIAGTDRGGGQRGQRTRRLGINSAGNLS